MMLLSRIPSSPAANRLFRLATIPWLLLIVLLSACGGEPAGDVRPSIPTQAAAPTGTAVVEIVSPEPPTVTRTPLLAPTATIAVPATVTPSPTPAQCALSWFFQPEPDSCPAGPPVTSAAAEQPFEHGVMIWLAQTGSIIVLQDDGRWQRYEDTWSEGEPESDPAIVPPEGRFQPIRGFGKLWRRQLEVRQALGWALGVELGFESTIQDQVADPDRPPLTYLRAYNGQVLALIGRAPDQGDWVVAADHR